MSLRERALVLVERVRRVLDEQAAAGKEPGEYGELSDVIAGQELGAPLVAQGKLTEDDYHLGLMNASAMALEPYGEISKKEIEEIQAMVVERLKRHVDIRSAYEKPDAPPVPEPRTVTGDIDPSMVEVEVITGQEPGGGA